MEIVIRGHNFPGTMSRNAGVPIHNVHVGTQVRNEPTDLVRADAASAEWRLNVQVVAADGVDDFRGPAVHGRKGERFLYLTWGDVNENGGFTMFRRAKLMLGDIDPALLAEAGESGAPIVATVDLTDRYGGPLCGRLDPALLHWKISPHADT